MISHARQSPAVPGFRVIADFRGLYTIGYTFLVPLYTPYIPGIYKHIDACLPFLPARNTSRKEKQRALLRIQMTFHRLFQRLDHGLLYYAIYSRIQLVLLKIL